MAEAGRPSPRARRGLDLLRRLARIIENELCVRLYVAVDADPPDGEWNVRLLIPVRDVSGKAFTHHVLWNTSEISLN
jgi:hypothetical protein